MATRSDYAAKIHVLRDREIKGLHDPGYDDHVKYREALARVKAYENVLAELKLSNEEDYE